MGGRSPAAFCFAERGRQLWTEADFITRPEVDLPQLAHCEARPEVTYRGCTAISFLRSFAEQLGGFFNRRVFIDCFDGADPFCRRMLR
jgi:hypothetical protein